MNRIHAVGLIATMVFVSGCATQYWDKDVKYEGVRRDIPQQQSLRVTSTPQAFLEVDGAKLGMTPRDVIFDYYVTKVKAAKYHYESSLGSPPRQIGAERHDETVVQTTPHLLRMEAKGYYPLYKPVSVPLDSTTLNLVLQKAGVVIPEIEWVLIVEARREYFEEIERIIGENPIGHEFKRKLKEPEQVEGLNIYRQEYFNPMGGDSVQFDKLVNELQTTAEKRHFVFKIVSASFKGRFSTNVLDTGIEHIVKGQTRPGSLLFLVKDDQVTRITNIAENGTFQFTVKLTPDEKYVFLVSKYKQILVVFNRVDVYSQQQKELTAEEFFLAIEQRNWRIDAKVIEALK